LENNPIFHGRTKHFDALFHFIKKKIQFKEFFLEYCNTCENVADIFTKILAKIKFELFMEMLGVEINTFSMKEET